MGSPTSGSESASFELLDPRIQRWIWSEGWQVLRDVQEQAIPALIEADSDVILAASTASGKTESAFFPILTNLLCQSDGKGCVLYISPLKALINDQWDRLYDLCESLDVPVTAWHGDINASKKHKFFKRPEGVLLITPESLESLFVRCGTAIAGLFAGLLYIVIDELHIFIGSERGKQLQSLMHRLELSHGMRLPRVGLSATLGEMRLAAQFLRRQNPEGVKLIVSQRDQQGLKVLVKGYRVPAAKPLEQRYSTQEELTAATQSAIADDLYRVLKNDSHLVFPNSRSQVELYADELRRRCEGESVPNHFWPHHGNLAKDIREETERALKDQSRATTAICTTTLELGIDIGAIKSVAQIGPPPSVASLRQRIGRSGRRAGEPAILRCYNMEPELTGNSNFADRIHQDLLQTIAMLLLLSESWFEPPEVNGLHASTFVQQLLSVVAEKGGATAGQLWKNLVQAGPFADFSRDDFVALLQQLGQNELLMQENSGLLLHGARGEALLNHYDFYSAFSSNSEYRLESQGKALGTISLLGPLLPDQGLIFAGRRWRVLDVDPKARKINVIPDRGGAPPFFQNGGGSLIHDQVRQTMKKVLSGQEPVPFLDQTARELLEEARSYFRELNLESTKLMESGGNLLLLTWLGDKTNQSIVLMLGRFGVKASNEGPFVSVQGYQWEQFAPLIAELLRKQSLRPEQWLEGAKNLEQQKWDWALPQAILEKAYAAQMLALDQAFSFLKQLR